MSTTTTYTAIIWDGSCNAGETEIDADSESQAMSKAVEWAKAGSWDQPGTIRVSIYEIDEDGERGDSIDSREVRVG